MVNVQAALILRDEYGKENHIRYNCSSCVQNFVINATLEKQTNKQTNKQRQLRFADKRNGNTFGTICGDTGSCFGGSEQSYNENIWTP